MAAPLRIAYMTGEYLRITPFVYIYREVAALRALGIEIETFSIRGLKNAAEGVDPNQLAEAERTWCVLPASPWRVLAVHAAELGRSPERYWRTLRLAWSTRPPGLRALMKQIAYFLEAALVAARMRQRGLTHLHNHFASSSGTVAMLAAELGGFTFSLSEHGPHIFFNPEWWRLDAKCARASFVACISHYCRSQLMLHTPVERWDRLHIVHCGVDPAEFRPRRHEGRGARLTFTGSLSTLKGVPILLEAIAKLRDRDDLVLEIGGDGPERAALEASVDRMAIRKHVRFLGYQSSDQVRALLQRSDVFVLPSFAEGVPVVLMEAMASGVPVVTTRIAGVPELVEDGQSGLLVPPGDVDALAAAITRLLDDGDLRDRMGAAGRTAVERQFDSRQEAERLRTILVRRLDGLPAPVRPS